MRLKAPGSKLIPMLTTAEVAAREGLCIEQVAKLCRTGRLWPADRMGKSWFIADPYILEPYKGGGIGKKTKRPRPDWWPGRKPGAKNKTVRPDKGKPRPRRVE